LLARLCWFWPSPIPFRLARTAPDPHWAISALDWLRQLDLKPPSPAEPHACPIMVPLVPEAVDDLESFAREMRDRQTGAAGLMRSALGKARGIALRLALILEHLWWCAQPAIAEPPRVISRSALAAAIRLTGGYLMPMAQRTYADAAGSALDRNVSTLARWIYRVRPAEVHVRSMLREHRRELPGLTSAAAIHEACRELVKVGLLSKPGRGRYRCRARQAYPVVTGGFSGGDMAALSRMTH
jgi:hypothetical protein